MELVAVIRNPASIARSLARIGEAAEPYWSSIILRRRATGYDEDA